MTKVIRLLICALFSSLLVNVSPINVTTASGATEKNVLVTCTSLKTGLVIISTSGNCNERIYESRTWYLKGSAPARTPGSELIELTTCVSKGTKTQIVRNEVACNPKTQNTATWQRALAPATSPTVSSVAMGTLGSATLEIKPPKDDGGARITSYLVTANPGGITATFTPAQIKAAKFKGLTPGVVYSFTVTALNSNGKSKAATSSAALAPALPDAPVINRVVATGPNSAQLTFTAPVNNGGAPITAYVITSDPHGLQTIVYQSGGGTINILNLRPGTAYTFTITAINIAGASTITPTTPTPSPGSASASGSSPAISPPITTDVAPPTPQPTPEQSPTLAAPAFTLTSSSESRVVNTAATGFSITSTGGAISSFAISPAAPAGMSFNTSTGAFTGTPTTVATATTYTITATNSTGSTTRTFSFTVTAASATAAAITTQPTGASSGSVLGTQPVIRIVDASGNTVTTSSVNVVASIASGTGTLTGTTTVAAVDGIATFTNLVITGTAGSFTLTFTPTSLTPATSNSFTLSARATLIAINAGNSQSANARAAVSTLPSVIVTDADNNPVSGVSVTFAVASGGGSITGATRTTNASGVATVGSWTLGASAGANTLTATSTGIPGSPVTFTATSVVQSKTSAAFVTAGSLSTRVTITLDVGSTVIGTFKTGTITSDDFVFSGVGASALAAGTYTRVSDTQTVITNMAGIPIGSNTTVQVKSDTQATQSTSVTAFTTGPGGGTIFYYSAAGFACGPTGGGTCNFLEAAPSGWNVGVDPTREWGRNQTVNDGSADRAKSRLIGAGYGNSVAIVNQGGADYTITNNAAKLARSYNGGGLVDWYLPTLDELNEMMLTRVSVGGIPVSSAYYWSSTEYEIVDAFGVNYLGALTGSAELPKNTARKVRPVRSF